MAQGLYGIAAVIGGLATFGLGKEEKAGLTVAWPWGQEQHWNDLPTDRYWRLAEDERDAQPFPGGSR